MKYIRPSEVSYESGLTAKLLCDNVGSLIKPLPTKEEIIAMVEGKTLLREEKLWDTPERRPELEEFTRSYLFSDLNPPLPGFEDVFVGNDMTTFQDNWNAYKGRLMEHYHSETSEVDKAISALRDEVKKRGDRLHDEIFKINDLEEDEVLKNTAVDAFGQLHLAYAQLAQVIMMR
jgi:hypothetical protein